MLSSYIIQWSSVGVDWPAAGGREDGSARGGADPAQREQEPGRGPPRGGRQQDGQTLGQLLHAGGIYLVLLVSDNSFLDFNEMEND